jgi:hypothetical protein
MSPDISSPSLLGLLESESELEELMLLPPGESLPCCPLPLGGLLPLEPVVMDRWMEPLPDRALGAGSGNSYSDSISSLSGSGIPPCLAHY